MIHPIKSSPAQVYETGTDEEQKLLTRFKSELHKMYTVTYRTTSMRITSPDRPAHDHGFKTKPYVVDHANNDHERIIIDYNISIKSSVLKLMCKFVERLLILVNNRKITVDTGADGHRASGRI